ncbi:CoA pyrophosphatase [Hyphobacterium sp. CCMP332]|nr:CoA pyrophosphatase [Hyphobacterium sp. CCMP332]
MNHSESFKNWLETRLAGNLPGEEAQYNLAPLKRREEVKFAFNKSQEPRISSVMLILYPENDLSHVPMIVRNEYRGVHSGQVALPGGKYEENDENILQTAIRETFEEINVKIDQNQIIGRLSHLFVPVSNFIIHPFVAWLDYKPQFVPDPSEVQEVLRVPLNYLSNPKNVKSKSIYTANGYQINAPGIPIEEQFLWGATAMLMSEFFSIVQEYKAID